MLLFLTLILVNTEALACEPIDLRGSRLGPVRDQGGIGWCYAFTSADLLSYQTGELVSSGALAIRYAGRASSDGGQVAPVLATASREGFCPQSKFNLEGRTTEDGTNQTSTYLIDQSIRAVISDTGTAEKRQRIKSYRERLEGDQNALKKEIENQYFWEKWRKNSELESKKEKLELRSREIEGLSTRFENEACALKSNVVFDLRTIAPALTLQGRLENIERHLEESKRYDYFADGIKTLYQVACQKLISVQPPIKRIIDLSIHRQNSRTEIFRHLNDQLSQKKPVSLTYFPDGMLNREIASYESLHASTVVGRRTNPQSGACEYLVRNSWGPDCQRKVGKPAVEKDIYKYPCEEGNIWVPENILMTMSTGLTYLD